MRIALRVDASPAIGLGHLQRCLALAHALRATGAEIVFVFRALGIDVAQRVADAGFTGHCLPNPQADFHPGAAPPHAAWAGPPWYQDAHDTVTALAPAPPEWLIVDHYAFDNQWQRAVAAQLRCRVAVIDDLADRDLEADLLLDHNLATPDHRHKYGGRVSDQTPILGGPRFALLGPAYATAQRYQPHDTVRSIGIFMGGTDPSNLSNTALQACRDAAAFTGPIEIVSTRANPHLAALKAAVASHPQNRLSLDLSDLAAFFSRHDLQIGAGGGASWERCCIGAPTLAVVAASNQMSVVPALAETDAVATLCAHELPGVRTIGNAVEALIDDPERRRALSEHSRALVDGKGALRAALYLMKSALTVRTATLLDGERMHGWRNHPATRATAHDTAEIALEDHMAWLRNTLDNPLRTLLVGSIGPVDVGVVRFDQGKNNEVEVSIYLDPAFTGLGLGAHLLGAGEAQLRSRGIQTGVLTASVLAGNTASGQLFANAGYRFLRGRWQKDIGSLPQTDRATS
jgi:UDP-2,4-diacetamido-2,4,6-trideoxy-beta-L-altropyranose hydrolase